MCQNRRRSKPLHDTLASPLHDERTPVEARCGAGALLPEQDTAEAPGVTERTVRRDGTKARA